MENILIQVFGMDAYAWLVLLLLLFVVLQMFAVLYLARAYNDTKTRLHVVTTDSISAYKTITEAMNYIRQDLANFTLIGTKSNDTIHKSIEHRIDRVDRALEELRRDIFRSAG
jgi:uncharacterized protein Yka (UPF0111/DUF47 family)